MSYEYYYCGFTSKCAHTKLCQIKKCDKYRTKWKMENGKKRNRNKEIINNSCEHDANTCDAYQIPFGVSVYGKITIRIVQMVYLRSSGYF